MQHIADSAALRAASSRSRCAAASRCGAQAIQQAPFRVLVGANMPAVLVEMGFISNPAEEKLLNSPRYQQAIVRRAGRQHRPLPRSAGPAAGRGPGGDCRPATCRRHSCLRVRRRGCPSAARAARSRGRGDAGRDRGGAASSWFRAGTARPRQGPRRRRRRPRPPHGRFARRSSTWRRRARRWSASIAKCRTRRARSNRRGRCSSSQLESTSPPLGQPMPEGTRLRSLFLTEKGEAFVDLSPEHRRQASGRLARGAVHGLCDRERADGQPAGDHRRADSGRWPRGRYARGSHRPPPAAHPEPDAREEAGGAGRDGAWRARDERSARRSA